MNNPENKEIQQILEEAKTIAVVGLSANKERTSYQVSEAMQKSGYRIIPVNPTIDEALGEKAYDSIQDVPEKIDIINVFRRSEQIMPVAEDAADVDCPVFWMQQGIVNEEAHQLLTDKGKTVIMDLCIKVAHAMLVKK